MNAEYQIIDRKDSRKLAQFLSKEGPLLLPMPDLITHAEVAVGKQIRCEPGIERSRRAYPQRTL